jgi:hypothetical protein
MMVRVQRRPAGQCSRDFGNVDPRLSVFFAASFARSSMPYGGAGGPNCKPGRPDCLQVVVALVVTTDGFPLAYEVMDGKKQNQAA